jgi:hypothetical protein
MDDGEYSKKLLIYSILVVLAAVCSSGTPLLAFVDLPVAWTITLGITAIVLFIYATAWFGSYLKLTGAQWAVAVLLALLAWVGSVIYMVTRKPNEAGA